jgi:glycosyltransferase involved in cell wall biosynthesis
MKVAFIHDWYTLPGGAEKVAKEIIDVIQPSGMYTLFNFMAFPKLQEITGGRGVRSSFIQQLPGADRHYRYLAPLFPKAIESFDLSEFDIIISSSWMAAKGVKKLPHQKHICYCHTPMRFAWDMEDTYLKKHGLKGGVLGWISRRLIKRLKAWDIESAKHVDFFISNSKFVSKRILTAYRNRSLVIYPPVDTKFFELQEEKEQYYFTASRLVEYKHIELLIEAFRLLPQHQLIIAGQGPLEEELRRMAPSNVKFLGWVSDERLRTYLQGAKAFLNASVEDFGIAGLEAQSCGTPVIALGKGGYLETVIDGETGIFFHREHPEAIADAVIRFEGMEFDPFEVRKHAKGFDRELFRERFLNYFLDKCFEPSAALV